MAYIEEKCIAGSVVTIRKYYTFKHNCKGENCRETDLVLIRAGQRRFEDIHSHEEWMSVFMKNYI